MVGVIGHEPMTSYIVIMLFTINLGGMDSSIMTFNGGKIKIVKKDEFVFKEY